MSGRIMLHCIATSLLVSCALPERSEREPNEPVSTSKGVEGEPCDANGACEAGLICVNDVCVLEATDFLDGGEGVPFLQRDAGQSTDLWDSGQQSVHSDAGLNTEGSVVDAGAIVIDAGALVFDIDDAGSAHPMVDSGVVEEVPHGTWGQSCLLASCVEGLICIEDVCEEPCGRSGACTNCCPMSGNRFCEPINNDLSLCRRKSGLLIELTWESEYYNFDLYFTKTQFEHCDGENSCYYRNCQPGTTHPMDFGGDGPDFGEGDPVMLIEDSCGYGPETIHLGGSSFGNYEVGVHLNNGNGQCIGEQDVITGLATVTIYLDASFHSEYSSSFAANGDFWALGYLDWINNDLVVTAYNGYESQWTCGGGQVP